jgi:hypothetical protein
VLGDLREIRLEYDETAQPQRSEPVSEPAPEIPIEKMA